jgi:hypothetical protein
MMHDCPYTPRTQLLQITFAFKYKYNEDITVLLSVLFAEFVNIRSGGFKITERPTPFGLVFRR